MRKISYTTSTEILLSKYYGFIHSHFLYGTVIIMYCQFVAQKAISSICKNHLDIPLESFY